MKTDRLRDDFLSFFKDNHHKIFPSDSLVPLDPTVLFTSAGMNQFKPYFLGEKKDTSRAATCQKCLRTQDIKEVGNTPYHHTFFEMLGNFSFGDYFKEEAIELAWTLITKEWGVPSEKLIITVYSEDDEAAKLWRKVAGLPEHKIIPIADKEENFWSMGDVGPCGPCSEIFYDHGDHIPGGPPGSSEAEGDRFVEIWNLVFMQYEKLASGEMVNLPKLLIGMVLTLVWVLVAILVEPDDRELAEGTNE